VAALAERVSMRIPWKQILLPVANSLFMVMQIQYWERIMPEGTLWFLLRLVLAAGGYLLILFCSGALKKIVKC
ncbi:MAG: hypothetical protein IJC12_06945, partial [Peptococcaceae bacterium]|nr:hypothetical protein [Peptococcaceae bacterium]